MAVICNEKAQGGTEWSTKPLALTKRYYVTGTDNDVTADSAVKVMSPKTYIYLPTGQTLYRQNVHVTRENNTADGYAIWNGEVTYGIGANPVQFDTMGGTMKLTQSYNTRNTYGSDAPDFSGGIGYDGDQFQGVDVTVPQFSWTEQFTFQTSELTQGYLMTLFQCTGKVNSSGFRGFAAGEVLFMGASGGNQKNETEADVSFKFVASPNVNNLSISGISNGITKQGWDYLWVYYEDDVVSQNKKIQIPVAAYVEQVYPTADYSQLGI